MLTLNYYIAICASWFHPMQNDFHNLNIPHNNNKRRSFLQRVVEYSNYYNLNTACLLKETISIKPPWTLPTPIINLTLTKYSKKDTSPLIFISEFTKITKDVPSANQIFTDGSKSSNGCGAAIICDSRIHKFSLNQECSIFTAELTAILKAINFVVRNGKMFYLFSDSLSTLLSLSKLNTTHPLIAELHSSLDNLRKNNCHVMFTWIPSHCGIIGNDIADEQAKAAIKDGITVTNIPKADLICSLKQKIHSAWDGTWHQTRENKLREIKAHTESWKTSIRGSRREEVVLTRLRIGHTRLTHSYLMTKDPPNVCNACGYTLTVKHLLTECRIYEFHRESHNITGTLDEILGDDVVRVDNLMSFLKESNLYDKI